MSHDQNDLPDTGFLRLSQVLKVFPVSRATWYKGVKAGRYPQPVHLGPRVAAYRAEDIRELVQRVSEEA